MVLDRSELARALSAIVDGNAGPAELPARLCAACLRALPVDGVGLSLAGGGHLGGLTSLGASDEIGTALGQLQYDLGEGPVASALAERKPVLVPDLAAPEVRSRWPVFAQEVRASGAQALFAFPLQLGAIGIGALDCYRADAGPLEEVSEAIVVAEAVTVAVLQAQFRDASGGGADSGLIAQSVGQHAVVHQATGMVSAQLGVGTDEAFVRLQACAFGRGQSLIEVSEDVVARRLSLAD